MTDAESEKSVLELIYDWSVDQSLWKSDALRRILQGENITADAVKALVEILRKEKSSNGDELIEAQILEKAHLPNTPKGGDDVRLIKISDTSNVNRLAPRQTLEFEPSGITVIFGNNGSGKSGYTRILKNACTARHRPTILPNIYDDNGDTSPSSSVITFSVGDGEDQTENWKDSELPHPVLSAVSVFDRECAEIHVGKANEVAFRPLGLDIPEKLVDVLKQVEIELKSTFDNHSNSQNAIFRKPVWKENTIIGKFVNGLSGNSVHDEFGILAEISDTDEQRIADLRELVAKDAIKAAKELQNKIEGISRLEGYATDLKNHYSDANWTKLESAIQLRASSRNAATLAANETFNSSPLKGVGEAEWRILWEAARKFSAESAYPEKNYPNLEEEALCVLCLQPYSQDAKGRLGAFDAFVKSDVEATAKRSEEEFDTLSKSLRHALVSSRNYKGDLEVLKLESTDSHSSLYRFLASARCRQKNFNKNLQQSSADISLIEFADSPMQALTDVKLRLKKMQEEYQAASTEEGAAKLQQEYDDLIDKKWASENLDVINEEIKRLKELSFIKLCLKDTKSTAVTNLGNKLADEAITPQLRDNFLKEINNLVRNKFRVEVVRSGGKAGAPKYKVQLVRSPNKAVLDILSEGEQTCVAIASFFSELSTSDHKSTLVFDDPISSLDHRWRVRAAERLVEEAKQRQVIIFTHDLIFLNDLDEAASNFGVLFASRHIKSTPDIAGIVDNNLPWDGMKIPERIDAMEKFARKIRSERISLDDEAYKRVAREFYGNLRASWERALEEVALSHTVMRHRDYINSKNVKNLSVLDHEICKTWSENFGKCCDFIEAHDTSRGRAQELPEPEELLQDIEILKQWVDGLKEAHKKLLGT